MEHLEYAKNLVAAGKKPFSQFLALCLAQLPLIDSHRVFITHCACPEDAEFLKTEIEKLTFFDEILITEAGSTIASHCGPKTIGILYKTK